MSIQLSIPKSIFIPDETSFECNLIFDLFSSKFRIPIEIPELFLGYLSIVELHEIHGASFVQLINYGKGTSYQDFKGQLEYSFDRENRMEETWFICKPIYFKLLIRLFKVDFFSFLQESPSYSSRSNLGCISFCKRLDLLQILYNETDSFLNDDSVLDSAGNIEIVKYLSNLGASCTTKAMDNAAFHGRLDIVKWLHVNRSEGCTTKAMDAAAMMVELKVVEWLHLNRSEGCTIHAMDNASTYGNIVIVKWLHENRSEGCSVGAIDRKSVV